MPYKLASDRTEADRRKVKLRPAHYRKLAAARQKAWCRKQREIVLAYYGNNYICCRESNPVFLAIYHIFGHGRKTRKELGLNTYQVYRDVIKAGFPDTFQLLCHNCNWAKYRLGRCPHQDLV
jgi:hypothetical protein